MTKTGTNGTAPKTLRCAIYTRKSTEEGLDSDFNSLDAQREAAEAFVQSQRGEGWTALPDRYDDGGYSGGNMDRPAVQRLLSDIAAKKVDVESILTLRWRVAGESALDVLERSPGGRLFKTADEVDDYVRRERESWEP